MKTLVIGRSGQLAKALHASGVRDVVLAGRPDLDLLSSDTVRSTLDAIQPDIVINAAAYTYVDLAETEPELSFAVNKTGPGTLARMCAAADIPLIHISTDCVFDGTLNRPYKRSDAPNPLGVYGASKLAGELAVRDACEKSLVFRVSWVFSEYANSFVRTMLQLAMTHPTVSVVSDQVGYPTYAPDLAGALLEIAAQAVAPDFDRWGLYHLAGDEEIDRASMATAIFNLSREMDGPAADVKAILTQDYKTPAARPLNARLDSAGVNEAFGIKLSDWHSGLRRTVAGVLEDISIS